MRCGTRGTVTGGIAGAASAQLQSGPPSGWLALWRLTIEVRTDDLSQKLSTQIVLV